MNEASCCFVWGCMSFLIIFLIGLAVVTISPTSALVLQAKQLKNAIEQICQICGDTVGFSATGDVFVACNECAFPVCRPCYEYERKEGNQCCPQCKTRYKRHKGSSRVPGDEDEDGVDDLDNEFNYAQGNGKGPQWQLQGQGEDVDLSSSSRHEPHHRIPCLTSGQQV